MDPASLAIGILPLVINIAEAASAVRQRVSHYKSAPSDIQNIIEKTELIGRVCSRLEVDLRSPKPHFETAIIKQALTKCYSTVSEVHSQLENVSRQKEGRKRSIQYVFRKVHIDRSLSDLNDSLSMLNTCITISTSLSINTIASTYICAGLASTEETPEIQEPIEQVSQEISRQVSIKDQRKRPIKGTSVTRSHQSSWFLFENLVTFIRDEHDEIERTHRSYLVGSPLLGTFVSLAMRYGPLSPLNLTLDAPRFIYERNDKALFDEILRCAPGFGATSQDVARWVARFNVKPNTQFVETSNLRHSMLGMLISRNKYESYKYLLDRVDHQLGSEQHVFSRIPLQVTTSKRQFETVSLYIDKRGPLLTIEEYVVILMPTGSPAALIEKFDYFKDIFVDEMDEFVSVTMEALVSMFQAWHWRFDTVLWGSSVSKLLDAGLDIHQDPLFAGHTALESILTYRFGTIMTILECAQQWMEVLQYAPVDIDRYLHIEFLILLETMELGFEIPEEWMAENMEPWYEMDVRTRLGIMFDILHPGRRIPLFVEPMANDNLLQIMPALREADQYLLSVDRKDSLSHVDWKQARTDEADSYLSSWPFLAETNSILCSQRTLKNVSRETTRDLSSHDRFLQLMNNRFERRQQKKWEKLKRTTTVAEETEQMPGGWKVEWWEYQGGW